MSFLFLNKFDYIYNIIHFITSDMYKELSFSLEDNIMKWFNHFCIDEKKEINYLFPLPKSNSIYRTKDFSNLLDEGPIEI